MVAILGLVLSVMAMVHMAVLMVVLMEDLALAPIGHQVVLVAVDMVVVMDMVMVAIVANLALGMEVLSAVA
jgi:hypothetical protein